MRRWFRLPMLLLVAQVGLSFGVAQRPVAQAQDRTVPALLVSDIHFDPFYDPDKVKKLIAAPASQWRSILSEPPSPNQQKAFDALQQTCRARGADTSFALFLSSLAAMRAAQPNAKFMTVSGDLIAHGFSCRYATLEPGSTPSDSRAFVLKTLSFVMGELRAAFPGIPVYMALGNNDSDCGDNRLDAGSDFLAQAGRIAAEGLSASQREQAAREFATGGYYSVTMAEPMRATRIVVLNDLFLAPQYRTCAGKPDAACAAREMGWLEQQLAQARQVGQKAWVVGHIPPGIDPFSTVMRFRNVCGGETPVMGLQSDKLADVLMEYADVVRLGIFGHTHMDEMHLLEPEGGKPELAGEHRVALKTVPSISPVNGNRPAFTVARVNPSTAMLVDYKVVAASNRTGIAATWATEYDYGQTYREAEFSPAALQKLIGEMKADGGVKSKAYIRNFFAGDLSTMLSPFWPQYACTLDNHTAKAYTACVCATGK